MQYPLEAEELAYAWERTGIPIDSIAEMHINLQYKLQEEKEHSKFIEELIETLYGEDWDKLTIAEAKQMFVDYK